MFEILNSVVVADAVEDPIANKVVAVSPALVWIANFANGDDEPTPILPEVGKAKPVEVAGAVPKSILPMLIWLLAVGSAKKMFEPSPIFPPPDVIVLLMVVLSPTIMLL